MSKPIFANLMEFLQKLEETDVYYALAHHHDEAIMVEVALNGERWEVEFIADGSIVADRFVRDDDLDEDEALKILHSKIDQEGKSQD
ncbi:MAG: hypothetical protein AAF629_21735 [Chloroflexota bacterium]